MSEEEFNAEPWLLLEDVGKKNVWILHYNGVEIGSGYALPTGETIWVFTLYKGHGNETAIYFALER